MTADSFRDLTGVIMTILGFLLALLLFSWFTGSIASCERRDKDSEVSRCLSLCGDRGVLKIGPNNGPSAICECRP